MSAQEVPVSIQKAFISNEVNSTVLGVLLWGIYSVVYIGTLYLYLTKKPSGNRLIVGATTLSYVAYSVMAILFWYYDQSAVVNDSDTRDTLLIVLAELGAEWPAFISDVMVFILAGVADGILIWRCFNVWGHSLRWISVPLFFLFCELVTDLIILILGTSQRLQPSQSQALLDDHLLAAQAFITLATTLTSTALIAYRIYRTLEEGIPRNSGKQFKQIIEILLQSAAMYSVAAIAQAIPEIIPMTSSSIASVQAAQDYSSVIFGFMAGIAPTILVARVAMLGDQDIYSSDSLSTPGSLRFEVQSTVHQGSQLSEAGGRLRTGSRGVLDISDNVNMRSEASNV